MISEKEMDDHIKNIKDGFRNRKELDVYWNQRLAYNFHLPLEEAPELLEKLNERLKFAPVEIMVSPPNVTISILLQHRTNLDDYNTDDSDFGNVKIVNPLPK